MLLTKMRERSSKMAQWITGSAAELDLSSILGIHTVEGRADLHKKWREVA